MAVQWSETALRDLSDLLRYTAEEFGDIAAGRLGEAIEKSVNQIDDFHFLGTAGDIGARKLPVGRYPFAIFYEVDERGVRILRLIHIRRNLEKIKLQ